jgi:hypothetical protein
LARADRAGSLSGQVRRNLVEMLDGIGVATALGVATCDRVFGGSRWLAAHLSALCFPVFVWGQSFTGRDITRIPALVAIIRQVLAAQLAQADKALVVPLGGSAASAVQLLIRDDALDPGRCILGLPHPSGANRYRKPIFATNRTRLSIDVYHWASNPRRSRT